MLDSTFQKQGISKQGSWLCERPTLRGVLSQYQRRKQAFSTTHNIHWKMLAWAEKQLDRLSKTVAPVSLDVGHQFKDALASGNNASALALLSQQHPTNESTLQGVNAHTTILNNTKGSLAIHVACEYGAMDMVPVLIRDFGVSPEQLDGLGNTPLHYATSSQHPQAFNLVQMLVNEYKVSLSVKNMQGLTPYDVCSVNRTRQWLLPIQLQRETQHCLDNGGVGLPPGIDLGGIKLPTTMVGPPPIATAGPPIYNNNVGTAPASVYSGPPSASQGISIYPIHAALPTMETATSDRVYSQTTTLTSNPPSAPSSGGSLGGHTYARTGYSSAALLPPSAKYRPDGFHSSSSDTALQEKYGHDKNVTGPPSGHARPIVPMGPPPTVAVPSNPPSSMSHGPSAVVKGPAWTSRRYPVYASYAPTMDTYSNPNANQTSASYGYTYTNPVQTQTQYNVFNPYAQGQQSNSSSHLYNHHVQGSEVQNSTPSSYQPYNQGQGTEFHQNYQTSSYEQQYSHGQETEAQKISNASSYPQYNQNPGTETIPNLHPQYNSGVEMQYVSAMDPSSSTMSQSHYDPSSHLNNTSWNPPSVDTTHPSEYVSQQSHSFVETQNNGGIPFHNQDFSSHALPPLPNFSTLVNELPLANSEGNGGGAIELPPPPMMLDIPLTPHGKLGR